jgi:hypothetical protein
MSMVRPVVEHGAACCGPCGKGKTNALDRVQTNAVQFNSHAKFSDWETLAQLRTIARLSALFKVKAGEKS